MNESHQSTSGASPSSVARSALGAVPRVTRLGEAAGEAADQWAARIGWVAGGFVLGMVAGAAALHYYTRRS